jgi:hypothetical protein
VKRRRNGFLAGLLLCALACLHSRAAYAYSPFGSFQGWRIGVGSGAPYGGLAGANISYNLYRFEGGASKGWPGWAVWGRVNLGVIQDSMVPWVRGGIGAYPYAPLGVQSEGNFAEGGLSICNVPNPTMACIEMGAGAMWMVSVAGLSTSRPALPAFSLALTYYFPPRRQR